MSARQVRAAPGGKQAQGLSKSRRTGPRGDRKAGIHFFTLDGGGDKAGREQRREPAGDGPDPANVLKGKESRPHCCALPTQEREARTSPRRRASLGCPPVRAHTHAVCSLAQPPPLQGHTRAGQKSPSTLHTRKQASAQTRTECAQKDTKCQLARVPMVRLEKTSTAKGSRDSAGHNLPNRTGSLKRCR